MDPEEASRRLLAPGTRVYDDAQSLFVGTVLAATGLAILQHLGFVTGQIAGLALLVTHWTGLRPSGRCSSRSTCRSTCSRCAGWGGPSW